MSPRDPCIEDLPVPLLVDILSRLPVKTIIHCKCVCKKWLNIVLDPYFADIQLSGSPVGFMSLDLKPGGILKWVEVEDELNNHHLHHNPVMSLDLKLVANLKKAQLVRVVSLDGLVCMWQGSLSIDNTYICNPITREYMILPKQQYSEKISTKAVYYCFGVGSLTRKYKVIRILRKQSTPNIRVAEVYTLGTCQWRSLGHVPYRLYGPYGQFLNGHAHWIIRDQDSHEKICSSNFDNETFDLFPSPPSEAIVEESHIRFQSLGVLKGCLCRCDTYSSFKLIIWVMKEYGIKESWHKELVIQESISPNVDVDMWVFDMLGLQPFQVVEGFKDGTILIASSVNSQLIVYCPQTKAILETMKIFDGPFERGITYRPSFQRLRNLENEKVHMF